MNTWAFRAPRLFQPWRILAAFHSPAPLAQRKLLTPSGVGYRNKTQTLTCPLNRGKSDDGQVSTTLYIRPTSQMWFHLVFRRRGLTRTEEGDGTTRNNDRKKVLSSRSHR